MKKVTFCVLLVILSYSSSLLAQWTPEYLKNDFKINDPSKNGIGLKIDATAFFKNNEYFSPIHKGRTLPGLRFIPTLTYQYDNKFLAEIGGYNTFFSGYPYINKEFSLFENLYWRFQYAATEEFSIVLGNLYGGVNHRLIEPLYKWEKHFSEKPESGLQLLFENERLFIDTWIDWKRYIEYGDPYMEVLFWGLSTETKLSSSSSAWQFSIPAQATIYHEGGQIDTSTDPMIVTANYAVGIKSQLKTDNNFIDTFSAEIYGIGYYDKLSNYMWRPYDKGIGIYALVKLQKGPFNMLLGYWTGDRYFSFEGEQLFNTFDTQFLGGTEETRNLIPFKFSYTKNIYKGIDFGAQLEVYHDLNRGEIDYSFGVAMRLQLGMVKQLDIF